MANRIGEIHRYTNPEQWRHIPGDINPADLLTRGLTATDLDKRKSLRGPLNKEVEQSIDQMERRTVTHMTLDDQNESPICTDNF